MKLLVIRERVSQENAVDAAGGRTADNIDINIAINQLLDDAVDTASAHGTKELLRNAIHVNRK